MIIENIDRTKPQRVCDFCVQNMVSFCSLRSNELNNFPEKACFGRLKYREQRYILKHFRVKQDQDRYKGCSCDDEAQRKFQLFGLL